MQVLKGTPYERIGRNIKYYTDAANFLKYYKQGIFTPEKMELINKMLDKDPNALRFANFAYDSASKQYMSAKTLANNSRRVYSEFEIERELTLPNYVVLWKKYFATDIQKQKLDKILQENSMKEEQKEQEEYQYSDMFKNNTQKIINLPTVIEEKWYEKVWNKIKDAIFNIFHR